MYKLLLCMRYLKTRYIALACIVSVMLGVATMIVVNSVMAGFSTEMRDRLHNFLSDIVIESRGTEGIPDANAQIERVRQAAGNYIAAVTPTIEIPGMMTFTDPWSGETFTQPVQIQGIDPAGKASVGPLHDYLDSFNPVIEDGQVVRESLRKPGETVGWELTAEAAEHRRKNQERRRMYLREIQSLGNSLVSPLQPAASEPAPAKPADASTTPPETPEFDSPSDTPQQDRSTAPEFDSLLESPPPADSAQPTPAATAPTDEAPANADEPGDATGGNVFLADQEPADSIREEPLETRVYIGEGLVSFQVRDEDTGRTRKVMMVQPGDDVIFSTVTAGRPPEVIKFQATVVDSFRSGMGEYDGSIVLMNLESLQKNRGMHTNNAITSIHIKLHDYADAPQVLKALEQAFEPGLVSIRTWEEKQGLLLSAVEVETAILNVLLFMIIAVAGFGILAIFYMIVVEKTRDIGILKSLGASSSGVMSIFLSYGLGLGIVGSSAGVVLGLLFVRYINEIEDVLSWITGRKVFDEKIYYFFEIPTSVSPWMVFWVAAGATGIAVLASILPARRAARLHPVRALRFE
ncbi:MAG: Lipoprotein-releasing system transrane protein LolE [Planctomycetota bacterium]